METSIDIKGYIMPVDMIRALSHSINRHDIQLPSGASRLCLDEPSSLPLKLQSRLQQTAKFATCFLIFDKK